ncbi:ATP-binding protein [Streptomyces hypolithicus]
MKQSAAKTLGAAALGAAFAAASAGSASAATAPALPEATSTLTGVTSALPMQEIVGKLPAGETLNQVLPTGHRKGTDGNNSRKGSKSADPLRGLLGGLPAGALDGIGR